jgi:hypothetical protein
MPGVRATAMRRASGGYGRASGGYGVHPGCRGAGRRVGWRVTRASGAVAEGERGKRRTRRLWPLVVERASGGRSDRSRAAARGRKGKADGWGPLFSRPGGEGEGSRAGARGGLVCGGLGHVGHACWAGFAGGERRKGETAPGWAGACAWAVLAGGLCGPVQAMGQKGF